MFAPKYRADIDGLRAVAVASVVIYHAFPDLLPGGFVGVDVFFVISGFLITSIIDKNLQEGKFSFLEFYQRRVNRIFPALLLVTACVLAFGFYVLLSDEFTHLGKHAIGAMTFSSNLILWWESGYFDRDAATKPLLHLWSLGVEEQFYLAWPAILWLCHLRRAFWKPLVGLAVVSFLLNLWLIRWNPTADFYSPMTRFWELLAGASLARIPVSSGSNRVPNALSVVGVGLLTFAIFKADEKLFPGWWATIPVLGTAMMVAAGNAAWMNRNVLSWRPIAALGLISYPLYLWHWPLLSFANILVEDQSTSLKVGLVAVSVVLAMLTFWLVEPRFRFSWNRSLSAATLSAAAVVVGLSGVVTYAARGFPERGIALATKDFNVAGKDWDYKPTVMKGGKIEKLNILPGASGDSVLFIGDSLMGQYFPRVRQMYTQHPQAMTAVFASRDHCTPIPHMKILSTPEHVSCEEYYKAAMQLAREPQYKKVVFGGDWRDPAAGPAMPGIYAEFESDLRDLREMGKAVVLISNPPTSPSFNPLYLVKRARTAYLIGEPTAKLVEEVRRQDTATPKGAPAKMREIAASVGAAFIDPFDYLCPNDECFALKDGKPLYVDGAHLRASYVRQNVSYIDQILAN